MKPTRSANSTETRRRSAAGVARAVTGGAAALTVSAVPHSPQNFTPGAFGVPHDGHAVVSDDAALAAELAAGLVRGAARRAENLSCHVQTLVRSSVGYVPGVTSESAVAHGSCPSRAWWLRVPATLLSPRSVFFALRGRTRTTWLRAASRSFSSRCWRAWLPCWRRRRPRTFSTTRSTTRRCSRSGRSSRVASTARSVTSCSASPCSSASGWSAVPASFRRARQIVGFALVPLAASLLVTLPLRLAIYGGDTFRGGGAGRRARRRPPPRSSARRCCLVARAARIGVRVVHGWDWLRTLGALVAAAALLAAIVGVFAML